MSSPRAREEVRALLADHEWLEAEVARLRARVRVEAEDVERAGVKRVHVDAWLRANGWEFNSDTGVWRRDEPRARFADHGDHPGQLADAVHAAAFHLERPALDILDEMAAMGDGE